MGSGHSLGWGHPGLCEGVEQHPWSRSSPPPHCPLCDNHVRGITRVPGGRITAVVRDYSQTPLGRWRERWGQVNREFADKQLRSWREGQPQLFHAKCSSHVCSSCSYAGIPASSCQLMPFLPNGPIYQSLILSVQCPLPSGLPHFYSAFIRSCLTLWFLHISFLHSL